MGFFRGNRFSYTVTTIGNILAFLTGVSIGWSSPVLEILNKDIDQNTFGRKITGDEVSWIGALPSLGGTFGPFLFGFLNQKIGRKRSLTLAGIPFLAAFLLAAFAKDISLIYISRILMGIGFSAMFCVLPVYVAEIAENSNRGILQGSTSSTLSLGILFSYCIGPYVSIMVFNIILSVISLIYIPALWFGIPESPYYLVFKGDDSEALKSLRFVRRRPEERIQKELEDIKSYLSTMKQGSYLDIFKTRINLRTFVLILALVSFQQFCGVIVILVNLQTIFDTSGGSVEPAISAIIVGSVQFVINISGISFIDRLGRRTLLLITFTGVAISEILLGSFFHLHDTNQDVSSIKWLPIFSLVLFMIFYNLGVGSLPWAVMAEIIPSSVISKSAVLITGIYWLEGFWLSFYFQDLSAAIQMAGCFWLFAACCLLCSTFIFFFIFETKGKSLAEIQDILNK